MNETYILNKNNIENIEDVFCMIVLSEEQYENDRLGRGNRSVLSNIISRIFNNGIETITVGIDNDYVDKIYRNCYYNHFSGKHRQYPRDCKRVFLFAGDCQTHIDEYNQKQLQKNFIGCFVVKPLIFGSVGRTFLNPSYCKEDATDIYVRTVCINVLFNGMKLWIEAFPYSMQDGETLTCAESTLLNIFDYASSQYSDYKFMYPSEIFDLSRATAFQRNLPAKGLSYKAISKIMCDFGFYPLLYINENVEDSENINRILSYYVESGIPVGVGLSLDDVASGDLLHSVVFIGHGKNKIEDMMKKLYCAVTYDDNQNIAKRIYIADTVNSIDKYIVMDDNIAPYSNYNIIRNKNVNFDEKIDLEYDIKNNESESKCIYSLKCICIPLHKRMCLEGDNARDTILEILKTEELAFDELYNEYFKNQTIGSVKNPFIIRMFLASSRNLKNKRIDKFNNGTDFVIKNIYTQIALPQFVWVCELYDKDGYEKNIPLGEIILDATSVVNTKPFDSVILISFLNTCLINNCEHNLNDMFVADNNEEGNKNFIKVSNTIIQNTYQSYENNLYRKS